MDRFSLNLVAGPWWLLSLIILVSVLFAVWTYRRTIPPTTSRRRVILITLRSLGLAALLFAIFQPIFTTITTQKLTPSVALFIDNSQSMQLPQRGAVQVQGELSRRDVMLKSIHSTLGDELVRDAKQVRSFTVGDRTVPFP